MKKKMVPIFPYAKIKSEKCSTSSSREADNQSKFLKKWGKENTWVLQARSIQCQENSKVKSLLLFSLLYIDHISSTQFKMLIHSILYFALPKMFSNLLWAFHQHFLFLLFVCVVLCMEPRASHMLNSTSELCPQPHQYL